MTTLASTRYLALFISAALACAAHATLKPVALQCEYLDNPLGIGETTPRLSWKVESSEKNQKQTAYHVLVSTNEAVKAGDLWDSGKINSDETTAIYCHGAPLKSGQHCYWKVEVWDKDGKSSGWTKPATWSMGLLDQTEWKGDWIGYDKPRSTSNADAPLNDAKWIWFAGDKSPNIPKGTRIFMSAIELPKNSKIAKAELYLSADDLCSFNINGTQVSGGGDNLVKRCVLLDVTPQIKPGHNILRAQVENASAGPAGLIAKLIVTTTDGEKYVELTDESWHATDNGGPNWHSREISDKEWPFVQVLGKYGMEPWGKLQYSTLSLPPPPYLRKSFNVTKKLNRATLYATALGNCDLYVNGARVSDDRFTPGWTDYTKRVYFRTYDVTKLVRTGDNATRNVLGAILSDGWYSGYIGWGQKRDHYGTKPRFRAQLQLEFADGTTETIATDSTWKGSVGPVRQADFLMGETYDARFAINFTDIEYRDTAWDSVVTGSEMTPKIEAHPGPAVRPFAEVVPEKITQPKPGIYIFNLGQNFAGIARLKVRGHAGQKITLRFAERLNPDGTVYVTNLRGARATDEYVCSGKGTEVWEPRFTFHGFQYVEVTGLTRAPGKEMITGIALSSETPRVGSFESSDPMLNKLASNIYWTQRANSIDIPTDCPQRDERLGWTGDAEVYCRAATLNCEEHAFYTKWLVDLDDAQRKDGQFPMVAPLKIAGDDGGPAWADAGVICPLTIYWAYDDRRILERHYTAMTKFIEFCKNRSTPDLLSPEKFHCFGDWLSIDADTPKDVIYEAFFAYSTKLVAKAAEVLGKPQDAAKYNELFNQIKAAFNKAYVHDDGTIKGNTQTCYALAISFGLLDPEKQKLAGKHLVDDIEKHKWHLTTGFIGTKNMMLSLAKLGRDDVAYRLIHNTTFPSWGFSIEHGATSIWERWDGWTPEKGFQDPGMNSFAHYSFGAVYQWMVENIGGIHTDGPGYKHIIIAPSPDGKMTSAHTSYNSIHGLISTDWRIENQRLKVDVTIPANTTATVMLPGEETKEIGSGTYHFD
jgi:alpha-L-rhamnosidase